MNQEFYLKRLENILPELILKLTSEHYNNVKNAYRFLSENSTAQPISRLKELLPSLEITLRLEEYLAIKMFYLFMKKHQGYIVEEKTDTKSLEGALSNQYYSENPEANILLNLAIEIIKEI